MLVGVHASPWCRGQYVTATAYWGYPLWGVVLLYADGCIGYAYTRASKPAYWVYIGTVLVVHHISMGC